MVADLFMLAAIIVTFAVSVMMMLMTSRFP
jgi:hypothetical protein